MNSKVSRPFLVFVREREMLCVRMRRHAIIYTDPSQKRFIRYLNLVVITWRYLRIRIRATKYGGRKNNGDRKKVKLNCKQ